MFEIVERFEGDAYRGVYTVRFEGVIYVLHVFQKKSPSGVRTAKRDVDLVRERLRRAREHFARSHAAMKGRVKNHDE